MRDVSLSIKGSQKGGNIGMWVLKKIYSGKGSLTGQNATPHLEEEELWGRG